MGAAVSDSIAVKWFHLSDRFAAFLSCTGLGFMLLYALPSLPNMRRPASAD